MDHVLQIRNQKRGKTMTTTIIGGLIVPPLLRIDEKNN